MYAQLPCAIAFLLLSRTPIAHALPLTLSKRRIFRFASRQTFTFDFISARLAISSVRRSSVLGMKFTDWFFYATCMTCFQPRAHLIAPIARRMRLLVIAGTEGLKIVGVIVLGFFVSVVNVVAFWNWPAMSFVDDAMLCERITSIPQLDIATHAGSATLRFLNTDL
jgi:hypothetical protein